MVRPDELDAIITSGCDSSSSWPSSFFLKSILSGPFSEIKSAPFTAAERSAVNVRFDCDAPGANPNLLRAGQAASTKRLSDASDLGATSVAITCRPFARNSAVQLAPTTPVPITATRLIGLLLALIIVPLILFRISELRVRRMRCRENFPARRECFVTVTRRAWRNKSIPQNRLRTSGCLEHPEQCQSPPSDASAQSPACPLT